jgi:hypothetical protein
MIAVERERQVNEEGWTPEHDDEHLCDALAAAAACYALPSGLRLARNGIPIDWPFEPEAWKPASVIGERIDELVKAGGLIAAEIDRLLRAREGRGPNA